MFEAMEADTVKRRVDGFLEALLSRRGRNHGKPQKSAGSAFWYGTSRLNCGFIHRFSQGGADEDVSPLPSETLHHTFGSGESWAMAGHIIDPDGIAAPWGLPRPPLRFFFFSNLHIVLGSRTVSDWNATALNVVQITVEYVSLLLMTQEREHA
jgi:hypothetical protein